MNEKERRLKEERENDRLKNRPCKRALRKLLNKRMLLT